MLCVKHVLVGTSCLRIFYALLIRQNRVLRMCFPLVNSIENGHKGQISRHAGLDADSISAFLFGWVWTTPGISHQAKNTLWHRNILPPLGRTLEVKHGAMLHSNRIFPQGGNSHCLSQVTSDNRVWTRASQYGVTQDQDVVNERKSAFHLWERPAYKTHTKQGKRNAQAAVTPWGLVPRPSIMLSY